MHLFSLSLMAVSLHFHSALFGPVVRRTLDFRFNVLYFRNGLFFLWLNENPFFAGFVIPNEDDKGADAKYDEIHPEIQIPKEGPLA